jgi:hypothetical protein
VALEEASELGQEATTALIALRAACAICASDTDGTTLCAYCATLHGVGEGDEEQP